MDDGEKLADVVGAVDRTIVENLGTGLKVDALVFHRTGIAGTGGITAQALATTSLGRGKTVSFLHEGGFTGILFILFLFRVGKQKGLAKTEMSMHLGVELQGHAHYVK